MNAEPIPPEIAAIINLLGNSAIKKAATRVPSFMWQLRTSGIEELLKPSQTAWNLKRALWRAVEGGLERSKKVKLTELSSIAGCSYDYAHDLFTTSPEFLVWVLRPPAQINETGQDLLDALTEKIAEIVRAPVFDERGRVLSRNANAVLRSVSLLSALIDKHKEY